MIPVRRINHVGIRVADLKRTRAFYERLGFVFIAGPVGPEPVAIMEHPSGVNFNFILNAAGDDQHNVLMDDERKVAGYTHAALEVENLDRVHSLLQELGIAVSEGPVESPDGARFLFVRDPDRNVLEFHQVAQKPDYGM